jgi:hypothetical protein
MIASSGSRKKIVIDKSLEIITRYIIPSGM